MEDTKKITTTEKSEENTRLVTPGCPYFIIKNFININTTLVLLNSVSFFRY